MQILGKKTSSNYVEFFPILEKKRHYFSRAENGRNIGAPGGWAPGVPRLSTAYPLVVKSEMSEVMMMIIHFWSFIFFF